MCRASASWGGRLLRASAGVVEPSGFMQQEDPDKPKGAMTSQRWQHPAGQGSVHGEKPRGPGNKDEGARQAVTVGRPSGDAGPTPGCLSSRTAHPLVERCVRGVRLRRAGTRDGDGSGALLETSRTPRLELRCNTRRGSRRSKPSGWWKTTKAEHGIGWRPVSEAGMATCRQEWAPRLPRR